ncbi:MAG: type I-E CRISPR-associated endonuclease Cas1 [Dehalococcoidia bacterium]|nr:type I-E CRISPR-associated endonuclease Cas1 [Dehalococcoidia bacterium]
MKDLHSLPKVRDSWSYLYVEHCRVDQRAKAIAFHDAQGTVDVPCASLSLLLLGPGTTVTHAAMRALAENGCMVCWTGESGVRFYAHSTGETRSAHNLIRQAAAVSDADTRLAVVERMYRMRFGEPLPEGLTLQQLRGREGLRVRQAYARMSEATGVPWQGRFYRKDDWRRADPVNRALSAANSCLYGICHAAIVATGYSPALGFIHTGKMLSFVYDVADLYKAEITIPVAFAVVAAGTDNIERRVRIECREQFYRHRLLQRIVPDIDRALGGGGATVHPATVETDLAVLHPGWIWDPVAGAIDGGVNHAAEAQQDTGDTENDDGPKDGDIWSS